MRYIQNVFLAVVLGVTFVLLVSSFSGKGKDISICLESPDRDCLLRHSFQVAQKIVEPLTRASTLAAVAGEQARFDDQEGAHQTFDAALEASESIKLLEGRLSTLRYISGRQESAGFKEAAKKTLSIVEKLTLQESNVDQGKAPRTLNPVNTVEVVENPHNKIVEIMLTASNFAMAGNMEAAKKMFLRATEVSQKLMRLDQRASMLLSIAGEQIRSGLKTDATKTLSMAFAVSEHLKSQELKNQVQGSIVLHYLKLEDK